MRHARLIALALVASLSGTLAFSTAASGAFGLAAFDGQVNANAAGDPFTQAGGHPYEITTWIDFNTAGVNRDGLPIPDGNVKDLAVDLPAGLVGDPRVGPKCREDQLEVDACPPNTQIGFLGVTIPNPAFGDQGTGIYNMVPRDGTLAEFGANLLGQGLVHLVPRLRPDGSFALTLESRATSQALALTKIQATLWGVPADPSHDPLRKAGPGPCLRISGSYLCLPGTASSDQPLKPFLTLPTDCSAGPLTTTVRASSWQDPGAFAERSFISHLPPAYPNDPSAWGPPQGVTGCDRLAFDPAIAVRPTTSAPDAPTGLDVELTFPQDGLDVRDGTAAAQLRDAIVTLPEGMTINPAGANGLQACSDAQLGLGNDAPVACPESSKVGTASAISPLLGTYDVSGHLNLDVNGEPIPDPLTGAIYIRSQASSDPASGEMFRIALVLENEQRGTRVKLPGQIQADPATGRLVTTFRNNPQLPVSRIRLAFKSGPRAPLATPATCGPHTVDMRLTSWAGHAVSRSSSFDIACAPGLGAFTPGFVAGTINPVGGASSPFSLAITKPDGNAPLSGLTMTLPTGLTARLNGNIGRQVGTAVSYAGPGSNPFVLSGPVFLEGRYADAPFSLRVVIPAKAGPFDLGEVVVRQKIFVDRNDAHVTIVSDPIPTIVKGVPVRLQRLNVRIDKQGFMLNPTSCKRKQIGATLRSSAGQSVPVQNRFQVGDCTSLPFAPKMTLRVGARGKVTRGRRTPLDVRVTMPSRATNIRSVQVTLPLTLNARLDVVNKRRACTLDQFRADKCPMVVGTATAVTPLLKNPLRGPAYFVYTPARRLPDLVVRLHGEVDFDLVGKVTLSGLKLRTTFDAVPDVPITSFRLTLASGSRNGPIGVTRNICSARVRRELRADLAFVGQSNKRVARSQPIAVAGCPGRRAG